MLWRNAMMIIMLMSVNTTIHDMSLKCFDDDYVIVHFLYSFWQNKVPWKIIWKVSYRCKFPALGPQRTAKFVIRKRMFQNSLHVYVHCSNSCGTLDCLKQQGVTSSSILGKDTQHLKSNAWGSPWTSIMAGYSFQESVNNNNKKLKQRKI